MISVPFSVRPGRLGAALAFSLLAAIVGLGFPAQAHHLVEVNQLSPTLVNGLLSGLAHPVLGPDHLAFLLALSLLGLQRRRLWLPALLAVSLLGSAAGLLLPGLSGAQLALALTLGLEALVLVGHLPAAVLLPAMALHGYGLSGTVLGWTVMPLVTYLLGLLLSQGLLLLTALALLRPLAQRLRRLDAGRHRLAWGLVGAGAMLALAAELR